MAISVRVKRDGGGGGSCSPICPVARGCLSPALIYSDSNFIPSKDPSQVWAILGLFYFAISFVLKIPLFSMPSRLGIGVHVVKTLHAYCSKLSLLTAPIKLFFHIFSGEQTIERQCPGYAGETSSIQLGFIVQLYPSLINHAFTT